MLHAPGPGLLHLPAGHTGCCPAEASNGTLLIMVGSEAPPEECAAWPVLKSLGKNPQHMGPVGTAAATKLALNQLIAALTVSFVCEAHLLQSDNSQSCGRDPIFLWPCELVCSALCPQPGGQR